MTRVHAFVSMFVFCVFSSSLVAQKPRDGENRKIRLDSIDATFASVREAEAKINHALFKRGDFGFLETPLADVASFITKNYSINVTFVIGFLASGGLGWKSNTNVPQSNILKFESRSNREQPRRKCRTG